MTFLHPALLYALPLAAVPLLLHLMTLHRLKTVELSTFRFLFDSYVQQRRRMRFLEALLAVLRTLFLLLLVLTICRPVASHWQGLFGAGGAGGREVVLLVDCSASMNARTGGTSAFDRAKTVARSVVERLNPDDRLTLIRVAARPEEVLSRFNTDTKGVLEAIEGLKPSSARANIFAALSGLFGPEAARRTDPLVYLFTDLQASGWKEVRDQGLDKLVPAGTPFVVVDVGSREPMPNVAVVGDAPRDGRCVVGLPLTLRPRVVNFSKSERAEVTLGVFLDEKEVARMPLSLGPGESAVRKVVVTPTEPGTHRGRFEVSARVPDHFPDDDRFLFNLSVEPRARVLLVNGGTGGDPTADEARYLAAALTAAPEDAAAAKAPAEAKEFLRALEVREVPESALSAESLRDASVVILANCGGLNGQFEALRDYVVAGGGLLILPGDKVNPDVYNDKLFPVPGPQGERLTGARLGVAEGDPDKAETFEQLASLDLAHPVLAAFDEADADARHFKTVRIYKRFRLEPPPKTGNAWTLARFANGMPALVESRLGEGAVILAAFPFHTRWTNLPTKPDFVPLVLRLAEYVARRPEARVSPVVAAGGAAELTVSAAWSPAEATVRDPAGRVLPLPLERAGNRLLAAFDGTSERGYYTVEVRGTRPDRPRAASLAFAVNVAPEESDFALLGEREVRELLPGGAVTFVDATGQAQAEGPVGKERELWGAMIWIVFGVIAAEFMLATLGASKGRRDEAQAA